MKNAAFCLMLSLSLTAGVGCGGGGESSGSGGSAGGAGMPDARVLDEAPVPRRPWNGEATGSFLAASSRRPRFAWSAVSGAASYDLEVDDSCETPGFATCAFDSPAISETGIALPVYVPASDLPVSTTPPVGTRYYWRVRACSISGCSPWSSIRYVDVGRQTHDFNGDGFADFMVGSSADVHVYLGGSMPDAVSDLVLMERPESGPLGPGIAALGDVNADGFADFAIGASRTNGNPGHAYVFYGGPALDGVADVVLGGEQTGDYFGDVAAAGDVDGDGYADLAVGAPGRDRTGLVYVFHGGNPMDPASDLTISFPNGSGGFAISGAGDVNGDGFADIVIGAAYSVNDSVWGPLDRVYVHFGGPSMDASADVRIKNWAQNAAMGQAVAAAGDIDGDDYADIVAGAPGVGAAGVFLGGPALEKRDRTSAVFGEPPDMLLTRPRAEGRFGDAATAGCDLNGDGLADFAVAQALTTGTPGGAHIFFGSRKLDPSADVSLAGALPDDRFGAAIAMVGDVNGDGFADLLVGAFSADSRIGAGRAYLYFGGASMDAAADLTMAGEDTDATFGWAVALVLPGTPSWGGVGEEQGQPARGARPGRFARGGSGRTGLRSRAGS